MNVWREGEWTGKEREGVGVRAREGEELMAEGREGGMH